jgi:hypothetical protein
MDKDTARIYNCAKCHQQVTICRICDRGNIYCNNGCAELARTESLRAAGVRYQSSQKGKLAHANRQQLYRENKRHKQKVTHQGSHNAQPNDLLSVEPIETGKVVQNIDERIIISDKIYCHFCGKQCSGFLRNNFLSIGNNILATLSSNWPFGP